MGQDNAAEVNTEFNRLEPPTDEDMLKLPMGWFCATCTVENPDMDALACYLCQAPRTFEEVIKYPTVAPVIQQSQHEEKQSTSDESAKAKQLTFVTWNVWCNEKLKVMERMQAIGAVISQHSPDIIALQECTPLILDVLQSCSWYQNGAYQCTQPPSQGVSDANLCFNVLMTKHEVAGDVSFKAFANSSTHRHLLTVPIRIKRDNGESVTVMAATAQLESNVAKSVVQLTFALSAQHRYENVIFGGDMGGAHGTMQRMKEPWVDCFHAAHPKADGFTYDTQSNGMLSGEQRIQQRVDRVLYKSSKKGNLQLVSCEMIGTEAISKESFVKTVRRENGQEQLILPVLPSHHYGLCATFDIV